MPKLPAFQFYPGDWLRDAVSGCSLAAQGLWLRMMIVMHDSPRYGYLVKNGGEPLTDDQMARRCGCSVEEYRVLFNELLHAGVPRMMGQIVYSKRMSEDEKTRKHNCEKMRKYREIRKRYQDVTPMLPLSSSSSSSSSSKKKRVCPFDMGTFTFFWTSYPRKVSKEEAKKAWAKLKPNAGLIEQIVEDVKRRTKFDPDWLEEGGKFIPYPATYLNRKRWEDEQTQLPDPHGWAKNPDGTWKREEEL